MYTEIKKIKMARKSIQQDKNGKEARIGCTEEGKRLKGNIREGSREGKTGTVLELS